MIIYGEFDNINGVRYKVKIDNGDTADTRNMTIGEDGLFFASDPIIIQQDVKDTFEHVIKRSAEINLVTESYIGAKLFASNSKKIKVTIYRENVCVFVGFVEPETFNQAYFDVADEFTLNCVDALSILKNYNYKNTTVKDYKTKKATADIVTFKDILDDAMVDLLDNDIISGATSNIYYDLSKGVDSGSCDTIFDDLALSETILYGETEDDVMTKENALGNILKYLNLHMLQDGNDFYIFDWNTLRNTNTSWYNLSSSASTTLSASTIDITSDLMGGSDTNVTIGNVYNQIKLTDNIVSQDVVFESPLDSESLTNVTQRVKYMREYSTKGSDWGSHYAWWSAFYQDCLDVNIPQLEKASRRDHYIQFCTSKNWKLYFSGDTTVDELYTSGYSPYNIAKLEQENSLIPMIIKHGSVDLKVGTSDNSVENDVTLTPYLYISIKGNGDNTEGGQYPSPQMLRDKAPLMEYIGETSAGCFSPLEDDVTNYLVFGGTMQLQSYTQDSEYYQNCLDAGATPSLSYILNHIVYNEFLRTRKWYTGYDTPITPYYVNENSLNSPNAAQTQLFKYTYSTDGIIDHFSKLPILECEMTIGNKRLVETDMDMYGNSTFGWYEIGQEPIENGERKTTFSLGINPKLNDVIVGQEYEMQNTVTIDMNLDGAKGTAIPIKKSDRLSGAVRFKVLGPVNLRWTDYIERFYPWWIIHYVAGEMYAVLSHCENIIIKDFTCKFIAGNSDTLNPTPKEKDNDLVYASAETDDYTNTKDDIQFDIITQISATEAIQKGVDAKIAINAVFDTTNDNMPLESLYNASTQETAKAEEHYVSNYYIEYSVPKIQLETELQVKNTNTLSWRNKYYNHNLLKNYFVQGFTLNAEKDTKTFTLKEV